MFAQWHSTIYGKSLLMIILFFHENVEASIICFLQQYVNKVIMYIFSHKAAGSHCLLPTFFWVSKFLQSSVYVHILMFLFLKGNQVEVD